MATELRNAFLDTTDPRRQQTTVASNATLTWAWVGFAFAALEIYILLAWVLGPNFTPTNPGADPLPESTRLAGIAAQGIALAAGIVFFWRFLFQSWFRAGRPDTTGLLVICWSLMWFWDPMMNFTSPHLLYNSHLLNFGSWTMGSTPGWTSPNGNLLPEPLLIVIPGYPVLCFGAVLFTRRLLRPYELRLSKVQLISIAFISLFVADTLIEVVLIRTGLYVFPGGIRRITLFGGTPYQFPMTEALFCSLYWTASYLLLIFQDNEGRSFIESGLRQQDRSEIKNLILRFFALFGYTNLAVVILWVVPNQWLGMHSDPYPKGLPSYLTNGMCVYGPNQDQCPGPGIAIPRPQ